MKVSIPLLFAASSLFITVMGRNFTVTNNCPYTIWPAIFTDLNVGTAIPNQPTGWTAPAFSSVSFFVPNNWTAGRIWGRRNCDFSTNPGPTSCLDGGCNGGLVCDPHTGTGVPPATLAQFTLNADPSAADFYDISLVDGYNLPMSITNDVGCDIPECAADLNPYCPEPLKGPVNSAGFVVGCKSACEAGLAPDPNNDPNCYTGSHNTPATCPPSGVQFYSYFKSYCPKTYAYAYDESSGSALFSCGASKQADYTITFCP